MKNKDKTRASQILEKFAGGWPESDEEIEEIKRLSAELDQNRSPDRRLGKLKIESAAYPKSDDPFSKIGMRYSLVFENGQSMSFVFSEEGCSLLPPGCSEISFLAICSFLE